jgi:hypothetical protein
VAQYIEPGHRFHFDVGDHNLWTDCVQLLNGLGLGAKWKNLRPFFSAERNNDVYHYRFIVDDDYLGHDRRAENISELRKGKQK